MNLGEETLLATERGCLGCSQRPQEAKKEGSDDLASLTASKLRRSLVLDDTDGDMLFLEEFLNQSLIPNSKSYDTLPSLISVDSNKSSRSTEEIEAYVMARMPLELKDKLPPEVWKRVFAEASKSYGKASTASKSTSRTTNALHITNHSTNYSSSQATSIIPDKPGESFVQPPVSFESERSLYSYITTDISGHEDDDDATEFHSSLEDMIPQIPSRSTDEQSLSRHDGDASSSIPPCSPLQSLRDEEGSFPSRTWNGLDGSLDYMVPLPQRRYSGGALPVFRNENDDDKVEEPSQSSWNDDVEDCTTMASRSWDEDCSTDFVVSKPLRYESDRSLRCVVFTTVQIRYYERILESHPCTSSGPSVGIGWNYYIEDDEGTPRIMNINEYEAMIDHHNRRRTINGLVLPREKREYILKKEWGFTEIQIAKSIRRSREIKNQRRQTIQNSIGSPRIEKVEYAIEKSKRRVSRMIGRRKEMLS